jgi:anaerobic selenocysteine-containing dehydrogenase
MTNAKVFDRTAQVPTDATNLPTACSLCSHNCGLRVDVVDNQIVAVRADALHPSTKGYSCNKAYSIAHYVNHAQRVQYPLKKQPDGRFLRISWDQAISEIAATLNQIRQQHAARSIAFAGLGGQGNHSSGFGAIPLMYGIGTPMVFTALAQEKTQHWLNDRRMIRGTHDLYLVPDKHNAKFMLLMGTNPHISNQGSNPKDALKDIFRDPDRRMVAVDPRITETTRLADRHLRIQPAKDLYLLLAIAGVIEQQGWVDGAFLNQHTTGYPQLAAIFQRVNIAEMAQRCGLSEADIRATAQEFAQTKPATIAMDLGLEHSSFNTLTSYMVRVLLLMTGNYGRQGGNFFVQLFGPKMPYFKHMTQALESSIQAIPAVLPIPQFPPAILPEEILSSHPDRIRALICDGTNPLASYPDTQRFRQAFDKLELLVVIDPAMSETAQVADYVLPAPAGYEKWEFSIFPKDIIAPQVRPPVVNGPAEALPEVEIYYRLARAMGLVDAAPQFLHQLAKKARTPWGAPLYLAALNSYAIASSKLKGVNAVIARSAYLMYETLGPTLPNPMLTYIWLSTLGYATTRRSQIERALPETKTIRNPFALTEFLFKKLLDHPEGVLLGHYDIVQNFEAVSRHKDRKARLYFEDFAQDIQRLLLKDSEPHDPEYPFVLNGGLRTGFTANTIMRDPSWRKGRGVHASLYMSESDAAALNAQEGDLMHIRSRRGSVTAPLKIDKNTLAGHLHLPNILGQQYPDPVTGELKATGIAINELVDATDRDPYTACPHTKRIRCQVSVVAANS